MLLKQKVFCVHDLPYRQSVYLWLTVLWLSVVKLQGRILANRLMNWMRHANLTEAGRSSCILNCNGLTCLRESRTCLTSWCSALCTAKLLCTQLISVNHSLMSHHCSLSDLPADDFHAISSLHMGFFCGWPIGLEFTVWQHGRCYSWQGLITLQHWSNYH